MHHNELITSIAKQIGFNDIRFIAAKPLLASEQRFLTWREKGYAADMDYLLRDNPVNARPQALLAEAKTIIILTANYYSHCPPRPSPKHGRIAAYAVGLDYHKVLRSKVQELINHPELKAIFSRSKFFTDAVPLLEKSFAKEAGLGFRGKNTLLLSKETGSFNFICEIITDLDLEPDWSTANSQLSTEIGCAKCTRCIDICPTNALPEPYQLDARKCISYHTIENRGEIPPELASNFGEWLFGCDLCQTICPYNRKLESATQSPSHPVTQSPPNTFLEFSPDSGFGHWLYLPELLDLELDKHLTIKHLTNSLETHKFIDNNALPAIKKYLSKQNSITDEILDHVFQIKFARTPLLRPKRLGLIRNAKIVLQNSSKFQLNHNQQA
jgi:epoxyqueuosine reductase